MTEATGPVRVEFRHHAAILTIDNPPVNVTSQAVRAGLQAGLDAALAAGVERIVLTGAGRAFVAGADAREFGLPPQEPHLPDLIRRIDASSIPVVAAINGVALGGGLELALACRARIAHPAATLGLPEVTLGVVPGAGGTQRLPRLTGIAIALDLIASGRSIGATEAKELGVIDALDTDPVAAALRLTLDGRVPVSSLPPPSADEAAVAAARKTATRRMAGQVAPLRAIELVEASSRLTVDAGMAKEREVFLALRDGAQSAALRHVFFAERAALSQRRDTSAPELAVVVGGGTMGAGIAFAMLMAGMRVAVVETGVEAIDRARANVAKLADEAVARGKMTEEARDHALNNALTLHPDYDDLPPAALAVEAVFEDLALKQEIFRKLEAALPPEAVLATNTSFLDVNRIAEAVTDPGRVLGLHFFSPAHVMRLLEVIRADATSDAALAAGFALARRLGKLPVQVGVCDGFVGNRILTRYRQVCDVMLLEGALPWEIDAAMRGFGMAMGPYEVQDLSGLQIAHANRRRLNWKTRPDIRYVAIADRVVEELGQTGRRSGAGWYDYAEGQKPSAGVEMIVLDEAARAGIERRPFGPEEIVLRATTAMMAEGVAILDEGIALRGSDIDLVLINGYGFPRWRGGPMFMADQLEAGALQARIRELAGKDPVTWRLTATQPAAVGTHENG